tara:strand:- start:1287 stop:1955 length:669 start_codon:yes stop_codon:yes gene_type:complete
MTTSGTVAYRPNIEEVIAESFERCGIDPQTQTGQKATSARRSLNLLFTEWSNRGYNYWTVQYNTIALTAGTSNYSLTAGIVDVIDMVYRNNSNDQPMQRISISEYNQIPDKTTSGKSSQFMLDRQYTPTINVWPVPDSADDTIRYYGVYQVEDITASYQDTDVPYRWTDAMCAGLAAKLATKFAPERAEGLYVLYERAFKFASDEEGASVTLRVRPSGLNLY